ncbi:MAG: hypothetical protein JNM79_05700 [Burkholderiales bacterium]|nr:hypothetical protein [Burkholderiales bacterium]
MNATLVSPALSGWRPIPSKGLVRQRAAFLLFIWFMVWMAAALTPAIGVHARGMPASATTASVVALAQFSQDAPDDQCVDVSAFDSIVGTLELDNTQVQVPQLPSGYCTSSLVSVNSESTGTVSPTSPAAQALALPLQGHMTRLRI